jgi:hypothetical protein
MFVCIINWGYIIWKEYDTKKRQVSLMLAIKKMNVNKHVGRRVDLKRISNDNTCPPILINSQSKHQMEFDKALTNPNQ